VTYPRGSVSGELRSTGAPHGDFVVRPVTCFTGEHWHFRGVWMVTETLSSGDRTGFQGGLKIVANRAGEWEAYVENPNRCEGFKCEQWQVPPERCRVFDVVVRSRHAWLRHDGHARIECAFPEGGTLQADLTFDRCGWVAP
jgi:hypothetical protein